MTSRGSTVSTASPAAATTIAPAVLALIALAAAPGVSRAAAFSVEDVGNTVRAYCECALEHPIDSAAYENCRKTAETEFDRLSTDAPLPQWPASDTPKLERVQDEFLDCMISPEQYVKKAGGEVPAPAAEPAPQPTAAAPEPVPATPTTTAAAVQPAVEPEPAAAASPAPTPMPATEPMAVAPPMPADVRYAWYPVDRDSAAQHLGKLVRIRDAFGEVYKGLLIEAADSVLVLRRARRDGGGTQRILAGGVRELAVFEQRG